MKKIFITMMVTIMAVTAFGCKRGENKTLSRQDETLLIMTSYIDVDDTKEGTQFEFDDRESAEDFMYYWLDYGQTVSGVIWNSDTDNYYVTVCESRFDEVCREVLNENGGYEAAHAAFRHKYDIG